MIKRPARILVPVLSRAASYLLVALLMAFTGPGSPPGDGDQQTDFDAALKAAEANRATTKGSFYDFEFTTKAAPWLGAALYTCSRNLSGLDTKPFIILVRVSAEGKAEEVLARPLTRLARCLRPRIMSAVHPKPPEPSWWIKLEVKLH
jgi:hypothetical protein